MKQKHIMLAPIKVVKEQGINAIVSYTNIKQDKETSEIKVKSLVEYSTDGVVFKVNNITGIIKEDDCYYLELGMVNRIKFSDLLYICLEE